MVAANTNLNTPSFLGSERRMSIAMALVLLPWLAVVLFTAGSWAALNFFLYAVMVFAAGYCIISVGLPAQARTQIIVLAPAVGILVFSALTAFWVRLGLSVFWVPVLWIGLATIGALCLWSDRALSASSTVAYGGALVLLSALICTVYLLPGARHDAVHRRDGSYSWMYVDTQYNFGLSAAVKMGSPPKEPGTVTEDIFYHFAGYAPAAAISRFDGLDLGDAYARVTRGASLWALMLACFGLGTILSLKATGEKFGGIMSVGGFFFYGALLAMFTDERNSSSYWNGAVLFKIPEVMVGHDGGPFSHLILGHSELHAFIAITAIMGLCLVQMERGAALTWRGFILLALPALAVTMHSVAGLYCLGIVGILLFWGHLGSVRSWLLIVLMLCLFLAAWKIMGYSHAPDAGRITIAAELRQQWWTIASAFIIGLGFRILGFRWISNPLKDPISAIVLASFLGLLAFFMLVHFKGGEEVYGQYFIQSTFSIFAFSRLRSDWWRGIERTRWVEEWLRLAKIGTIVVIGLGLLHAIGRHLIHQSSGIVHFHLFLLILLLVFAVLAGTLALMKRSPRYATIGSALVMGVLLIGFLAWIPPWLNFGVGRMKMDVTLAPGEVQGLNRLHELASPGEIFATNKHTIDSLMMNRNRSYAYGPLSERPVLVEGLQYHTPTESQAFADLLRDNDLMFSTTDPDTLRRVAEAWSVRWLVARPGTDIALPKPLPSWLVEQQNTGDLRIYRID